MRPLKRYPAFLAYLLGIFGWLYVFLFHRRDGFAVYHARQSMAITIIAVVTPIVWVVAAWAVSWVPMIGAIAGASLFAFVIMTYIALAVAWVMGIVHVWQAKARPVPFVGRWGEQLPFRASYPEAHVTEEAKAEPI